MAVRFFPTPPLIKRASFDHETVKCQQPCSQAQDCGHPCLEPCHVKPCRCLCGKRAHIPSITARLLIDLSEGARAISGFLDGFPTDRSPQKHIFSPGQKRAQNHTKPRSIDVTEGQQAWEAFAAGGHVAADAKLHDETLAAAKAEQQRRLDEEMAHALFGAPSLPPLSLSRPSAVTTGTTEGVVDDDSASAAPPAGEAVPTKWRSRKAVWTPFPLHEVPAGKQTSLLDLE